MAIARADRLGSIRVRRRAAADSPRGVYLRPIPDTRSTLATVTLHETQMSGSEVGMQLKTGRLDLVPCNDEHLDGLSAINSDPEVMRYITG